MLLFFGNRCKYYCYKKSATMRNVLLIIGLLFTELIFAQEYVFEHISSNEGLSNNLVRDIAQDDQGYLWFATFGGLNRYDGYSFEVYKTVMGDTLSLSDSRVIDVAHDLNGFIWTISSVGEIHRVDPASNKVINLKAQALLPQNANISEMYISGAGDVWIQSNRGVLRIYYESADAYMFKVDHFNEQKGLSGNSVNFIHDDKNGHIWLGTNKGLIRVEIDEEHPERFDLIFEDRDKEFTAVVELDNTIYFGTSNNSLMVYEFDSGMFYEEAKVNQKLKGPVSALTVNNRKQILIGTSIGDLALFDPHANVFNYYPRKDNSLFDAVFVSEIFADSYGVFWIVTEKRGIFQFNPSLGYIKYFDLNSQSRSFLGENDKQILLEDSNRDLWVGINGGGVFLFDRKNDQFKQFKHNPNNTSSLSSDIVLSLFEDHSKNLWIGTSYGGVNKLSLKKEQLRQIKPEQYPQTDFDNYIRSVTTDVLGNIWVGTKAGKIYVYKGNRKIGTIPDDLYFSDIFPATNVYCLFFDNEHNLWVGSKGNGIYIFKSLLSYINNLNNRNIEVVHLKNDPDDTNSLSSDNVYSIKQDIHGQYWIGTFNGGLNLLTNPFSQPIFQHFSDLGGDPDGIVSAEVRDLYFDRDQNLWIATSNGVSVLKNHYLKVIDKQFLNLSPSLKDSTSMAGKVVYQIKQGRNGDIFIAMLDGGLNWMKADDFKNGHYSWQHQNSEVLSPNAYSIEQDSQGNIWMGTDNGLYRMNVANEVIEKYRFKNNFVPLTFSEACSQKSTRQELIFGSNEGFLIFHPDSIQKDTTQYPLKFSLLEVNGEKISISNSSILNASITKQKEVELSHTQNNITLHFSVLDFNDHEAIQYSYILEGYDNFWSNASTSNVATYRKLPPGNYVLKVRGTNSSGSWMQNEAQLGIQINPPFWKSTIGYILIILIASLTITISTIVLYRQFILQNRMRMETALTEKRMEYYTNISHEFKTPLSLILSPVEEIIVSHKSSDFARQKGLQIKKNAIYLKRLIEQILDFRKIREGKMQLKVMEVNLIEFFREIYLVFLPLAKKMDILFEYNHNVDEALGYIDVRQLEKVIYNLLSNAFRFTPAGKHVDLIVKVDTENHSIEIKVVDEGNGIEEQELAKLFERFSNSKSSSGIGLFFTKELVLLHKGEIEAFNNTKGGATFRVSLPTSKSYYSSEEMVGSASSQLAFDLNSIEDIETIISSHGGKEKVHQHVVDYMETILVVEDNEEMRNYLSTELSAAYKIIEADNGADGLELARNYTPDLIISDVIMPKMNGYDLTKTLKEDFITSHIPIILLTGESSDEKKLKGVESGADDYIIKPFNINYLNAKIEKIITQRKKLKKRIEQDLATKEQPDISAEEGGSSDFMEKVQSLVMENLSKPELNVEFLVEKMGISRTLFFKKMKGVSGYAPNEYLRIVKMKEAARMLTSSDKTISEISNAVGFNDSNYFGKTFKKHFGETPSVYKSNNSKRKMI